MIYKVIRRFTDENGKHYRAGSYVEIKDPSTVKLRIRRRDLFLARDQEGAKKLVEKPASEKSQPKQVSEKEQKKETIKNVKKTKKQKTSTD